MITIVMVVWVGLMVTLNMVVMVGSNTTIGRIVMVIRPGPWHGSVIMNPMDVTIVPLVLMVGGMPHVGDLTVTTTHMNPGYGYPNGRGHNAFAEGEDVDE